MNSAKVKMNSVGVIKAKLGINADGRTQKFFTNTCYRYMEKYVPRKDDNLRKVVSIKNDSITYLSPYADYQYKGMRKDGTRVVKNYTTPGTGPYWDRRMVSAELGEVIKETKEYMEGR